MAYDHILFDVAEAVATITLNRAEHMNSVTGDVSPEMEGALRIAEEDDAVRVIIVTGAGDRAFCAGADTGNLANRAEAGHDWTLRQLTGGIGGFTKMVRESSKPSIAAVNGVAAGIGMGIALGCDLRVMADTARFVPAFTRIGLTMDGGTTKLLPEAMGIQRTFEMLYTSKPITASEALNAGLANRVVPSADLMNTTRELAQEIANGPPIAIGFTKKALVRGLETDLESALYYESYANWVCRQTQDSQEGVRAFQEKRRPRFAGR